MACVICSHSHSLTHVSFLCIHIAHFHIYIDSVKGNEIDVSLTTYNNLRFIKLQLMFNLFNNRNRKWSIKWHDVLKFDTRRVSKVIHFIQFIIQIKSLLINFNPQLRIFILSHEILNSAFFELFMKMHDEVK